MTPLTEEAQQKYVHAHIIADSLTFVVTRFITKGFASLRAGVQGAVTNGQITCVAREMVMQRQVSESSDAGSPTAS